jgi:hypothetical protein
MSNLYPKNVSTLLWTLALALGFAGCGDGPAPTSETAAVDPPARAAASTAAAPAAQATGQNSAPRIGSIRFEPEEPTAGESVRAIVEAADPDGDSLWIGYSWRIDGEPVPGDTPRLLLRGVRKGMSVEVFVTARDGKDASDTRRQFTDVRNAPPDLGRIRVEPSNEVVAGTPIVVRPEASDKDGDAMTFSYAWRVNDVAVREEGPQLATERLNRGDRVQVVVWASDGHDSSEPVSVPELLIVNAPPRIIEISGAPQYGGEYFYRVRAEDPDGDHQLQFELEDPPQGMSIDALSGEISWRPEPDQVGSHSVAVVVDDLHGGRSRQSIEVTVSAPDVGAQPPARAR